MSTADVFVMPTLLGYAALAECEAERKTPTKRSAPFNEEPGFHGPAELWLYGNAKLLDSDLVHVPHCAGPNHHSPAELDVIEREVEHQVLEGKVVVCGIHNEAHRRSAVVPLRWGSPRILVFSGGFYHHLGEDLSDEPFRAARLWRYQWDHTTDLAISRRAPEKLPTYASHNPTVDRMIATIAQGAWPGLRWIERCGRRVLV